MNRRALARLEGTIVDRGRMRERESLVTHTGGCQREAIQFEVDAPEAIAAELCNCSICSMTAFLHLIVPASRFRLLQGEENLLNYSFNTHTAQHSFCKFCGIRSFYIPRSNPDGFSMNVRCLRPDTIASARTEF